MDELGITSPSSLLQEFDDTMTPGSWYWDTDNGELASATSITVDRGEFGEELARYNTPVEIGEDWRTDPRGLTPDTRGIIALRSALPAITNLVKAAETLDVGCMNPIEGRDIDGVPYQRECGTCPSCVLGEHLASLAAALTPEKRMVVAERAATSDENGQ